MFWQTSQTYNVMMDFKWTANLEPCYLLFLSILRRQQARRVPQRHTCSRELKHKMSLILITAAQNWCAAKCIKSRENILNADRIIIS